jgi:SAM-dependent methyltransferase
VDGRPVGELDDYVTDSLWRFLYTWSMVESETGRCLELGANPYFTTWLLQNYTDLELTLANCYGDETVRHETLSWVPPHQVERAQTTWTSTMFNAEVEAFPYPDDSFDVVLFCELIEHFLTDPLAALREIHRVLAPGGLLILTTPNVARLENVMRLLHGVNLYDPYSGYGPYGRHNREYTRHELWRLLEFAGFEVEDCITADGNYTDSSTWGLYEQGYPLVEFRNADLGHYLFIRARATGVPQDGFPSFLYRSRKEDDIVPFE